MLDEFRSRYLHRQPYAQAGSAHRAVARFGWDTLDRLLTSKSPMCSSLPKENCSTRRGRNVLADLRSLMQNGIGIVMRRAEREDVALAAVAELLPRILGAKRIFSSLSPAWRNVWLRMALRSGGCIHRANTRHKGFLFSREYRHTRSTIGQNGFRAIPGRSVASQHSPAHFWRLVIYSRWLVAHG
jgi:hypothetical protein